MIRQLSKILFIVLLYSFWGCEKDNITEEEEQRDEITYVTISNNIHNINSQAVEKTIKFPEDTENIEEILMYVKLRCPNGKCGAWDVYSNVRAQTVTTNTWYEIGRFITPYGVDNSQRNDGFVFDVTDFKSILKGFVNIRSFVEVWTEEGWFVSIEFKLTRGEPTYKYTEVVPIINYADNSQQIPYGKSSPSNFKLNGYITIPSNTENLKVRTVITGWGHATPGDGDRRCAEWCFRVHNLKMGENNFAHEMDALGCSSNPISPQSGNWEPDRAGWCPGMEVPIREDILPGNNAGEKLSFNYELEEWLSDEKEGNAFYSISSYVIVGSNTEITKPIVE